MSNEQNCGIINDMTRKGIQLLGIEATPGSTKTFAVVGDKTGAYRPFIFKGVCQWTEETTEGTVTGYTIVLSPGEDTQQAKNLLESVTLLG